MATKFNAINKYFQRVVNLKANAIQSHKLLCKLSCGFQSSLYFSTSKHVKPPIKLVVFDKDGTLTCFHTMWAPWCEHIAKSLELKTGRNLSHDIFQLFNYNEEQKKIKNGALAEKSHAYLQALVIDMLHNTHNITRYTAKKVVSESWNQAYLSGIEMVATIKPVCNVRSVFLLLQSAGIKIAICTSDNRPSTLNALHALNVIDLVDRVVCDGDLDNVPKPSPDNIFLLCRELGIDVQQTAVIGDTPADTQMGRHGSAGLVIGVLSGVCTNKELAPDADLVFNNIVDAISFILDPTNNLPTNKPNSNLPHSGNFTYA